MIRIYFAFIELDTPRIGGPWWYRDFRPANPVYSADSKSRALRFVADLKPLSTGLYMQDKPPYTRHDLHNIVPPGHAIRVV